MESSRVPTEPYIPPFFAVPDRFYELGALIVYLVVLMWIGIRSARQVRSWVDYTLAGRDVPWLVILATTAATMVGGGASVGMTSRVYEVGIAAAFVTSGWHLQLIFTGLYIAPRLRGLNLVTVGDFFELKFGSLARALAVVNCIIFLIGAVTAQLAAMGTITNSVLGIPYEVALVVGAAVTVFYSTIGGIRAVVTTDVLQFVILVGGMGTASALLVSQNGGFQPMLDYVGSDHFSLTGHWSATRVASLFVAFLLGEMLVPPYAQRCFIARDAPQARRGVAGGGLFLLLFLPVVTFVVGVSAAIDPVVNQAAQENVQQVYPALVRTTFHPLFSGVMLAALAAAAMSSADSSLSSHATVVMEDIYRRYLRPGASPGALLRVAQITTLATGIAGAVCAYLFSNIAEILEFVYDFWAPAMIIPFLVGVLWYHESRVYAVVISMMAGMVSTVIWRYSAGSHSEIGPALFGTAVATVAFFVALPLTRGLKLGPLFQPRDPYGGQEEPS